MSYLGISERIRYRTFVKCQYETDLVVIRSVRTLTHSDVYCAIEFATIDEGAETLASMAFGDPG